MNATASPLFLATRSERLAVARRRYFEEGLLPSGIVSHAVYESWARCQRLYSGPAQKVAFQPVSSSRTHLALQRNRDLVEAWQKELPKLQLALGSTSCAAMLTDASGVLIGATCVGRAHERLMPVVTRTGVNLCEEAVGTTAPGVAARTGQAVTILGAEHFFNEVDAMHCAAAPIRNARGQLCGVLDISSESIPFNFDAAAVVGLYAAAIEDRLLIAQSTEHLVVRFQIDPVLLDSHLAALAGIDSTGAIAWLNATASRLLGVASVDRFGKGTAAEDSMGASLSQLVALPARDASLLRLSNGLTVWARAEMNAPDGYRNVVPAMICEAQVEAIEVTPEAVTAPDTAAPARLRDCDKDLIERTLTRHGRNVSKTARELGVSRGLIYRRLRDPLF